MMRLGSSFRWGNSLCPVCNLADVIVVVCTHLSGKEPHRQVGVGRVVESGSLGGVMISTLAEIARDVGLISALELYFPYSLPL